MKTLLMLMLLTSVAYASSCEPDCTKVLIAKAEPRIREQVIPAKPEPKKDDIKVVAYYESDTIKATQAKCVVKNDTITCEW